MITLANLCKFSRVFCVCSSKAGMDTFELWLWSYSRELSSLKSFFITKLLLPGPVPHHQAAETLCLSSNYRYNITSAIPSSLRKVLTINGTHIPHSGVEYLSKCLCVTRKNVQFNLAIDAQFFFNKAKDPNFD